MIGKASESLTGAGAPGASHGPLGAHMNRGPTVHHRRQRPNRPVVGSLQERRRSSDPALGFRGFRYLLPGGLKSRDSAAGRLDPCPQRTRNGPLGGRVPTEKVPAGYRRWDSEGFALSPLGAQISRDLTTQRPIPRSCHGANSRSVVNVVNVRLIPMSSISPYFSKTT